MKLFSIKLVLTSRLKHCADKTVLAWVVVWSEILAQMMADAAWFKGLYTSYTIVYTMASINRP